MTTSHRVLFGRGPAVLLALGLALPFQALAEPRVEPKPAGAFYENFQPVQAPKPGSLLLRKGDRLAICGDSITEQKMYSKIIETYLTVCEPELQIDSRQYGWSGETAEGFRRRMTNDCLRFQPSVATLCYGMNDYRYRPADPVIDAWYQSNYTAVVRAFKAAGTRVVLGSPGCVGKIASWVKPLNGTLEEHNLHLCGLRNIALEIARSEHVRFADIFWPMYTAGYEARSRYGADYAVSGKDGVHPGWAGQLIMARACLKNLGLDGDLGRLTVNLKNGRGKASDGHEWLSATNGAFTFQSKRYPFCATGAADRDDSLRSGMTLIPFNAELNRLTLVVKGATAPSYQVTWGPETRVYTGAQLAKGINLAEDFAVNPFSDAFKRVDDAVAAKQAFETRQVKEIFHGKEAKNDMAAAVARTEPERQVLVQAVRAAFKPVVHTLQIAPAPAK